MKATIEKISNQSDFGWRIQTYRNCAAVFDWHYHFEYEIVLQRNCSGKIFVGDYIGDIKRNNLSMFGPKLPHTVTHIPYDKNKDSYSYILWFSHDWVSTLINTLPELNNLKPLLSKSAQGIEFEENIAEKVYLLLKDYQEFSAAMGVNRLLEVLILLSEAKNITRLNTYSLPALEDNPKELKLVQKVSDFIELNYRSNIQVNDLCKKVHVSESTIYRLFERHFVCSFSNHVKEFRIGKACELLVNSHTSIAIIADLVGFTNLSNFNRQFKQSKGMTPKQFRALFS